MFRPDRSAGWVADQGHLLDAPNNLNDAQPRALSAPAPARAAWHRSACIPSLPLGLRSSNSASVALALRHELEPASSGNGGGHRWRRELPAFERAEHHGHGQWRLLGDGRRPSRFQGRSARSGVAARRGRGWVCRGATRMPAGSGLQSILGMRGSRTGWTGELSPSNVRVASAGRRSARAGCRSEMERRWAGGVGACAAEPFAVYGDAFGTTATHLPVPDDGRTLRRHPANVHRPEVGAAASFASHRAWGAIQVL